MNGLTGDGDCSATILFCQAVGLVGQPSCSFVTRDIFEMYDADAQPTEDPDEAIAAVVKVGEDQYIVLNLADDRPVPLN